MLKTVAVAGLSLFLLAAPVLAQPKGGQTPQTTPDWQAQPRYATVDLRAGFEPDPREIQVQAGGDREVRGLGADCGGWIDFSKPDVDLNYTAGTYPLFISVVAGTDTTLVINDAAGNWICNDDLDGLNPGIVIPNPASGNYNIWIGTFEPGAPQRATLRISEVPPRR